MKFDPPFGSLSTNENEVKKEEKRKNWKFFIIFHSLIIKGKVVRKWREEKWSFISSPPHTQLWLQILPLLERNFGGHENKSLTCFITLFFLLSLLTNKICFFFFFDKPNIRRHIIIKKFSLGVNQMWYKFFSSN